MRFQLSQILVICTLSAPAFAQFPDPLGEDTPKTVRSIESIRREAAAQAAMEQRFGYSRLVGTVRAKLLTTNGVPVAGIVVKLLARNGELLKSSISDNDGRVQFPDLSRGDYKLVCANPKFFERNVTVPITIAVQDASALVTRPDSTPPPLLGDGTKVVIGIVAGVASAVAPVPAKVVIVLIVGGITYFALPDSMRIQFEGTTTFKRSE